METILEYMALVIMLLGGTITLLGGVLALYIIVKMIIREFTNP